MRETGRAAVPPSSFNTQHRAPYGLTSATVLHAPVSSSSRVSTARAGGRGGIAGDGTVTRLLVPACPMSMVFHVKLEPTSATCQAGGGGNGRMMESRVSSGAGVSSVELPSSSPVW